MAAAISWDELNQQALVSALSATRRTLEQHIARVRGETVPLDDPPATPVWPLDARRPALEQLCAAFHLSPFERELLLICAGIELEASFGSLCAIANGDPQRTYPTFSLALATFPNGHWSALTPAGPLRRWRLIEVSAGGTLMFSPLRIEERVLHYLAGASYLDERLSSVITPVEPPTATLVPSHQALVERVTSAWSRTLGAGRMPAVLLNGEDRIGKHAIASSICTAMGLHLYQVAADALPQNPAELEMLVRLWERESALDGGALLLDCEDLDPSDAVRVGTVARLIDRVMGAVVISGRERVRASHRTTLSFEVGSPSTIEQRHVWQTALGETGQRLNGHVDLLVSQFNLNAPAIHAAGAEVLAQGTDVPDADLGALLWETCRAHARPRLDDLSQRIEAAARWDDLVLPEAQRQILRDVAAHVRQRAQVYERWGFGTRGARGLGISALFAGVSGTGKTMAAEVLAGTLNLDLYRIDLSAVVSKYIGETEKNLRRIFDAAEAGGAILLFDEADALFGKRSEVKDSHDRYANIEVSYLLQRMECYRGLAILTTNLKSAIDTAFLRRIRFVVQFPFPDAAQRGEIWRRIFPQDTPTDGLDVERLARLNVAGGNIRNIALNGAFLAADAGEPVRMAHLLRAARAEYSKLEKSLTDAEIAGWV